MSITLCVIYHNTTEILYSLEERYYAELAYMDKVCKRSCRSTKRLFIRIHVQTHFGKDFCLKQGTKTIWYEVPKLIYGYTYALQMTWVFTELWNILNSCYLKLNFCKRYAILQWSILWKENYHVARMCFMHWNPNRK